MASGAVFARLGQEQIDELPRRIAVGQAKLGAVALERLGAIVLGLARPARQKSRHGPARVMRGLYSALEIDGGHRRLQRIARDHCGKAVARASRAT